MNYLMTYIGDKGKEIYTTFTIRPAAGGQPAERDMLEGVFTKYRTYVAPRYDQLRATFIFNQRKQGATERFDSFATDLKLLIKDCGNFEEDRLLRDAIALQASHEEVREKCLDEGDTLTVEKAIQIGQNYETSQESLKLIGRVDEDAKVNQVRSGKSSAHTPRTPRKEDTEKKCGRCGYPSSHTTCPAVGEEYYNCHKKGNFGGVCRSKKTPKQQGKQKAKPAPGGKAHAIDEWESDEEYAHLISSVTDTISAVDECTDSWVGQRRNRGCQAKDANRHRSSTVIAPIPDLQKAGYE